MITPELLAPAGSFKALCAAIDAGADAVYFGGEAFGARAYAKNFTRDEIAEAARLCRAYGVKSYITLNTLIFDREAKEMLEYAAFLEENGIDALIIADMGAASLIHEAIPSMRLHASTQFSGHEVNAAKMLEKCGFERMVAARELSFLDLTRLCKESPIEIESFIHGALCVCHSGQCLMSSMIGERSGNRGMCAQPCRLPDKYGRYPLSLKDLSMANRIPKLLSSGVASLKIEGRMKSPEYVHGVVKIYRRLLDEKRNATPEENLLLEEIFSRGGFTSGYFDKKINSSMLGIRTEEAKQKSRELATFDKITKKLPIKLYAKLMTGMPFEITVSGEKGEATVKGAVPEKALSAPLDKPSLEKNLLKLGSTPYFCKELKTELDDGLILRVSEINALRREAIEKYTSLDEREHIIPSALLLPQKRGKKTNENTKTALVMRAKNLPKDKAFYDFFDIVYLPLSEYIKAENEKVKGVLLPAVIFDSEKERVCADLEKAREMGALYALVANYGHIPLATQYGLIPHGDSRLNVTSSHSFDFAVSRGLKSVILSPELTLVQIRDIGGHSASIVYGRLPLMLLEKCVAKELSSCKECENDNVKYIDRTGASFPVLREEEHRSLIFNSVPTYMLDKAPYGAKHFIFTVESADEIMRVIDDFENRRPPKKDIRRIKEK